MRAFQFAQAGDKKNESIIKCNSAFTAAKLEHKPPAETALKDVAVDLLSHMTEATYPSGSLILVEWEPGVPLEYKQ